MKKFLLILGCLLSFFLAHSQEKGMGWLVFPNVPNVAADMPYGSEVAWSYGEKKMYYWDRDQNIWRVYGDAAGGSGSNVYELALADTSTVVGAEGDLLITPGDSLAIYTGTLWRVIAGGGGAGNPTDELQTIDTAQINGNSLEISLSDDGESAKAIDLSMFLDNTDDQQFDTLDLDGTTLRISLEGDGVPASTLDLSSFIDDQTVTIADGGIVTVSGTYPNFTVIASETDGSITNELQTLTFNSNDLTLSNGGGTVDLSLYLDNTDNQTLNLTANTLSIEDGNSIDLTPYLDNTDNQILTISNDTIYLEDGGFVALPPGTVNTDDQVLSISNDTLFLEDGGFTVLSSFLDNTDDQFLSIAGDSLFIESGNGVDLSLYRDTSYFFNTVSDLSSSYLINGDYAFTKGFSDPIDGRGALYRVQADTIDNYPVDGVGVIALAGGNYAILQPDDQGRYHTSILSDTLWVGMNKAMGLASEITKGNGVRLFIPGGTLEPKNLIYPQGYYDHIHFFIENDLFLSSTWTLPYYGATIQGGLGESALAFYRGSGPHIYSPVDSIGVKAISFSGNTFRNVIFRVQGAGEGLRLDNAGNAIIENCGFNAQNAGGTGLVVKESYWVYIDNCSFNAPVGSFRNLEISDDTGSGNDVGLFELRNSTFSGHGVYLGGSDDGGQIGYGDVGGYFRFVNITFENKLDTAFYFDGSGTTGSYSKISLINVENADDIDPTAPFVYMTTRIDRVYMQNVQARTAGVAGSVSDIVTEGCDFSLKDQALMVFNGSENGKRFYTSDEKPIITKPLHFGTPGGINVYRANELSSDANITVKRYQKDPFGGTEAAMLTPTSSGEKNKLLSNYSGNLTIPDGVFLITGAYVKQYGSTASDPIKFKVGLNGGNGAYKMLERNVISGNLTVPQENRSDTTWNLIYGVGEFISIGDTAQGAWAMTIALNADSALIYEPFCYYIPNTVTRGEIQEVIASKSIGFFQQERSFDGLVFPPGAKVKVPQLFTDSLIVARGYGQGNREASDIGSSNTDYLVGLSDEEHLVEREIGLNFNNDKLYILGDSVNINASNKDYFFANNDELKINTDLIAGEYAFMENGAHYIISTDSVAAYEVDNNIVILLASGLYAIYDNEEYVDVNDLYGIDLETNINAAIDFVNATNRSDRSIYIDGGTFDPSQIIYPSQGNNGITMYVHGTIAVDTTWVINSNYHLIGLGEYESSVQFAHFGTGAVVIGNASNCPVIQIVGNKSNEIRNISINAFGGTGKIGLDIYDSPSVILNQVAINHDYIGIQVTNSYWIYANQVTTRSTTGSVNAIHGILLVDDRSVSSNVCHLQTWTDITMKGRCITMRPLDNFNMNSIEFNKISTEVREEPVVTFDVTANGKIFNCSFKNIHTADDPVDVNPIFLVDGPNPASGTRVYDIIIENVKNSKTTNPLVNGHIWGLKTENINQYSTYTTSTTDITRGVDGRNNMVPFNHAPGLQYGAELLFFVQDTTDIIFSGKDATLSYVSGPDANGTSGFRIENHQNTSSVRMFDQTTTIFDGDYIVIGGWYKGCSDGNLAKVRDFSHRIIPEGLDTIAVNTKKDIGNDWVQGDWRFAVTYFQVENPGNSSGLLWVEFPLSNQVENGEFANIFGIVIEQDMVTASRGISNIIRGISEQYGSLERGVVGTPYSFQTADDLIVGDDIETRAYGLGNKQSSNYLENDTDWLAGFSDGNRLVEREIAWSVSNDTMYLFGQSIYLGGLGGGGGSDDQLISLSNDTLYLEDGGFVLLDAYLDNTDAQTVDSFFLNGNNLILAVENDGQTPHVVDLGSLSGVDTDDQGVDNFSISTNILSLEIEDDNQAPHTVDLSPYLDNVDNQVIDTFRLEGNVLELSISKDGEMFKTVSLTPYLDNTDDQVLSLVTNTLSIEDGNSVDLSGYLDNTDAQDLDLSGNTLSLTGDGTNVDLSGYLDNTDTQDLGWTQSTGVVTLVDGGNITILSMAGAASGADGEQGLVPKPLAGQENLFLRGDGTWANPSVGGDNWGSQVVQSDGTITGDGTGGSPLSVVTDDNQTIDKLNLNGTILEVSLEDDGEVDQTVELSSLQDGFEANTDNQQISDFSITTNILSLEIENDGQVAQTVDLSPYLDNTDNQDLSLTTNILSLTGDGTPVDLSGYLDNTDDQTLTWNEGTRFLSIENGGAGADLSEGIQDEVFAYLVAGTNITFDHDDPNNTLTINATGGGGVPGGTDGTIQYNNGGVFSGGTDFYWDDINNRLGVGTSLPDYEIHTLGTTGLVRNLIENTGTGTGDIASLMLSGDVKKVSLNFYGSNYNNGNYTYLANNALLGSDNDLYLVSDTDNASGGTSNVVIKAGGVEDSATEFNFSGTGAFTLPQVSITPTDETDGTIWASSGNGHLYYSNAGMTHQVHKTTTWSPNTSSAGFCRPIAQISGQGSINPTVEMVIRDGRGSENGSLYYYFGQDFNWWVSGYSNNIWYELRPAFSTVSKGGTWADIKVYVMRTNSDQFKVGVWTSQTSVQLDIRTAANITDLSGGAPEAVNTSTVVYSWDKIFTNNFSSGFDENSNGDYFVDLHTAPQGVARAGFGQTMKTFGTVNDRNVIHDATDRMGVTTSGLQNYTGDVTDLFNGVGGDAMQMSGDTAIVSIDFTPTEGSNGYTYPIGTVYGVMAYNADNGTTEMWIRLRNRISSGGAWSAWRQATINYVNGAAYFTASTNTLVSNYAIELEVMFVDSGTASQYVSEIFYAIDRTEGSSTGAFSKHVLDIGTAGISIYSNSEGNGARAGWIRGNADNYVVAGNNNYKFGVGTQVPQEKLDVDGNIHASGAVQSNFLDMDILVSDPTLSEGRIWATSAGLFYRNSTTTIQLDAALTGGDNQGIDTLDLVNDNLRISLEDDGVPAYLLDLSSFKGVSSFTVAPETGAITTIDSGNTELFLINGNGIDVVGDGAGEFAFYLNAGINMLSDVDTSGIAVDEFFKWDGSNWVSDTVPDNQILMWDEANFSIGIENGGSYIDLTEGLHDEMDNLLVAGTGIDKTYNDIANTLTVSVNPNAFSFDIDTDSGSTPVTMGGALSMIGGNGVGVSAITDEITIAYTGNIADQGDVNLIGLATNDFLQWDGLNWSPTQIVSGNGQFDASNDGDDLAVTSWGLGGNTTVSFSTNSYLLQGFSPGVYSTSFGQDSNGRWVINSSNGVGNSSYLEIYPENGLVLSSENEIQIKTPAVQNNTAKKGDRLVLIDENTGKAEFEGLTLAKFRNTTVVDLNAAATDNLITWQVEDFDVSSNFTFSGGIITVPDTGYYRVTGHINIEDVTAFCNNFRWSGSVKIEVDGVVKPEENYGGYIRSTTSQYSTGIPISFVVFANGGDQIRFLVDREGGATSTSCDASTVSATSHITFEKIGRGG